MPDGLLSVISLLNSNKWDLYLGHKTGGDKKSEETRNKSQSTEIIKFQCNKRYANAKSQYFDTNKHIKFQCDLAFMIMN
jgi:hypothetical protein